VRRSAAINLNNMGPGAANAVPALIAVLKDGDADVRWAAAKALGNIGPASQPAIHDLIGALKDSNDKVRAAAAAALGGIGADPELSAPALIEALKDKSDYVRKAAAEALGKNKPGASANTIVPALTAALRDESSDVRATAADSMAKLGADARSAVAAVTDLLRDGGTSNRWSAARILAGIGPDAKAAVPALLLALKDDDVDVRIESAAALGRIGQNQPEALEVLKRELSYDDDREAWRRRARAAGAIGGLGAAAQPAIPALTRVLNDPDGHVRRVAAFALERIATALREGSRTDSLAQLKEAQKAIEGNADRRLQPQATALQDSIASLEKARLASPKERLLSPVRALPIPVLALGAYGAAALLWLILVQLSPLTVFRINEVLRPFARIRLPGWLGGVDVPLSHFIAIGFFHYRDRVLDAWVGRHAERARSQFELTGAVKSRAGDPKARVMLDDATVLSLDAERLRPVFAAPRAYVLICGDAGSGKTSLACGIARWGMEPDAARRLAKHLMLPVLLDTDFAYKAEKDSDPLVKTVRDKLYALLDEGAAPSEELVEHLLERRRVLVIVDGLSERSQETQSSLRPGAADFRANALVVTSRVEEELGGVHRTIIRPMRSGRGGPPSG